MDLVDRGALRWTQEGLPLAYGAGVEQMANDIGIGAQFTRVHRQALEQMQRGAMKDVLTATRFVRRDAKRLIGEIGRMRIERALVTGRLTAEGIGQQIKKLLRDRGLAAVRYANGARIGMGQYGQMLARTVTARAYSRGSLIEGDRQGVSMFEVFDGPDCGWSGHRDPNKANGTLHDYDECRDQEISHPNCRRAFGPRPDVVGHQPLGAELGSEEGTGGANVTGMRDHEAQFQSQGGKVSQIKPAVTGYYSDRLEQLAKKMRVVGDLSKTDNIGFRFTNFALNASKDFDNAKTFVATTSDGTPAGALDLLDKPEIGPHATETAPYAYIDYLGSTGILNGAGTSLVNDAVRYAAQKGYGLAGDPTYDALPFWRDEIGWHSLEDEGLSWMGWTPTEVRRINEVLSAAA